jgi:hypothetical protein
MDGTLYLTEYKNRFPNYDDFWNYPLCVCGSILLFTASFILIFINTENTFGIFYAIGMLLSGIGLVSFVLYAKFSNNKRSR